jgi:hypothetical protein
MSHTYARTRSNEAEIWYKPVQEKKTGPGKGNYVKSSRLKIVPQKKLQAFIDKHFDGNLSRAAREFGFKQVRLFRIVSFGVIKRSVIEKILSCARKIDPTRTEKNLFIPPKKVKVVRIKKTAKKRFEDPDIPKAIKPSMGGFARVGPGALSAAIARVSGAVK